MYLDPEAKIDMSLDDIIYHEKQHQRYIERLLKGRQAFRQNKNDYHVQPVWNRNTPYRRKPNWQQHYRSSLNRVKWFYQGQRYFSYRSRFQNWNRVKNWSTQQRLHQHGQRGGGGREQEYDEEYDDGMSDCASTFSSVSKKSQRRRWNRRRRTLSSLSTSMTSLCSSGGFKRPEIPYPSLQLNNLMNLVIKINNKPETIKRKFGRGGRPLTLNERFTF